MRKLTDILKCCFYPVAITLLFAWLVGFLSMVFVYTLPTAPMEQHVKASIATFEQEGNYPQWAKGITFTQQDNFTDALMLSTAIFPKKDSTFVMAMKNYNYARAKDGSGPAGALVHQVNGQFDELQASSYERYWHGYNVVLKPLLLAMNFSNIRCLNYMLQFGLLIFLFVRVNEKFGWRGLVGLGFGVLVLNPESAALSLQFAPIFYTTVIACLLCLKTRRQESFPCLLFLLSGICSSFFDLLTYPIVSLGLPFCLFLCSQNMENTLSIKRSLSLVLGASVLWGIGYFGMWFGKWVIATLITDQNVFLNAYNAIQFRLDGEIPWMQGQEITVLRVLRFQLGVFNFKAMLILILAFMAFLGVGALKNRSQMKAVLLKEKGLAFGLILTSLMPMGWATVIKNHSIIHTFFTHKGYAITFCSLTLLALMICYPRENPHKSVENMTH